MGWTITPSRLRLIVGTYGGLKAAWSKLAVLNPHHTSLSSKLLQGHTFVAKRKTRKTKKALAIQLEAPTVEQMHQQKYDLGTIIHAETFTRTTVYRVRQQSSLRKMLDDGQLTEDQFWAAQEIAHVAEHLQRGVGVRSASLEARVDCSGSSRDMLIEKLGYVRAEATYSRWRTSIAIPRRMIVDMVLADRALFATARTYHVGWPRAKRLLQNALDRWNELREQSIRSIGQNDLDKATLRVN